MSTPTSVNSEVAGTRMVGRGARYTKVPLIIVGSIFVAFAFGLYYAAMSRVVEPELAGGLSANLLADGPVEDYKTIEFTQGRSDGMVGVTASDPAEDVVNEEGSESDLSDQIAAMLEKQRLAEFERSSEIQNSQIQRQYEQAQAALDGDVSVNIFQRGIGGTGGIAQADSIVLANSQNRSRIQGLNVQRPTSDGRSHALSNPEAAALSSTDVSGVVASKDFVSADYRNDFTLREELKKPDSEYQVMTGTLIPGVMVSAVNSELPGDLIAQVTQDVYDSVTGRYLLIPQGSKLFGRYDSFASLGAERLLMVWDRLVLPDGESLTLGSIQGYDDRGMSGANDRVITHFWKTLGNALLLSVVSSAGDALVDEGTQGGSIIADITANFGSTSSTAFEEYLSSRLQIKPTFEIRSGYRFNIIVNRDINFPEPFEFGYTRLELR